MSMTGWTYVMVESENIAFIREYVCGSFANICLYYLSVFVF